MVGVLGISVLVASWMTSWPSGRPSVRIALVICIFVLVVRYTIGIDV